MNVGLAKLLPCKDRSKGCSLTHCFDGMAFAAKRAGGSTSIVACIIWNTGLQWCNSGRRHHLDQGWPNGGLQARVVCAAKHMMWIVACRPFCSLPPQNYDSLPFLRLMSATMGIMNGYCPDDENAGTE